MGWRLTGQIGLGLIPLALGVGRKPLFEYDDHYVMLLLGRHVASPRLYIVIRSCVLWFEHQALACLRTWQAQHRPGTTSDETASTKKHSRQPWLGALLHVSTGLRAFYPEGATATYS